MRMSLTPLHNRARTYTRNVAWCAPTGHSLDVAAWLNERTLSCGVQQVLPARAERRDGRRIRWHAPDANVTVEVERLVADHQQTEEDKRI